MFEIKQRGDFERLDKTLAAEATAIHKLQPENRWGSQGGLLPDKFFDRTSPRSMSTCLRFEMKGSIMTIHATSETRARWQNSKINVDGQRHQAAMNMAVVLNAGPVWW